jgi:hypothetical protein
MVPKRTDPMTKFIRTGEGILVFAFNIALVVVPIVSNALTPAESAKWATIIDGIAVISRTGLKMVASAQAGKPTAPAPQMTGGAAAQVPAAPPTAQVTGAAPAALTSGAPAPDGSAAAPAQLSGAVMPQIATLATDIADVGQLVSDAEEFADAPSAAQSEPDQQSNAVSAPATAGLIGSNSQPPSPFVAQLGG